MLSGKHAPQLSAENSKAGYLASLPVAEQKAWLNSLSPAAREALLWDWSFWGRPKQFAPPGNWTVWIPLAGRGFGKTRCGAEWVRSIACGSTPLARGQASLIAIVAETAKDLRETVALGPSGILAVHPPDFRPKYSEKSGFTWPNGCRAYVYNGTEPEQLRGPNFDHAWCDELCKWRYAQQTWDMLEFCMRQGENPRVVVTTTPRPIPLLKELMRDPDTVVTVGSTNENAANLSAKYLERMQRRYAGTRLGRQELNAEILDDVPGALWNRRNLDDNRRTKDGLPKFTRVVIGVDPAAKPSNEGDSTSETGVVVAALGEDGRGYVLDDQSNRLGPAGWARKVAAAFDFHEADSIVVEINQGGAMVERVMRAERPGLPLRQVRASRGKTTRAEPVAALYEQGRISHVGSHPELEDQMVLFTPFGIEGDGAADRVDALVWALSDLFPHMTRRDEPNWTDEFARGSSQGGWLGR